MLSLTPKTTEKVAPGQVHARIVEEAESNMRQFNTPAMSADLMDKIVCNRMTSTTTPVEWSTYHQMTNIHRLQLETLFDSIYGLDAGACTGFDRARGNRGWDTRSELLRAVLISLASLSFVRTSTTITMGTSGPHSKALGSKECMRKLVANEGIASLKADYELILKLITNLTESPSPKLEEALIRTRR